MHALRSATPRSSCTSTRSPRRRFLPADPRGTGDLPCRAGRDRTPVDQRVRGRRQPPPGRSAGLPADGDRRVDPARRRPGDPRPRRRADMPTREELPEPLRPLALPGHRAQRRPVELRRPSPGGCDQTGHRQTHHPRRRRSRTAAPMAADDHRPVTACDGDVRGDDTRDSARPHGSAPRSSQTSWSSYRWRRVVADVRRTGGCATPGSARDHRHGGVPGSTPALSEPSADATEASEPTTPGAASEIAFVKDRTDRGGGDLYTVSVDDGETDRLTNSRHTDGGPVWRPRG